LKERRATTQSVVGSVSYLAEVQKRHCNRVGDGEEQKTASGCRLRKGNMDVLLKCSGPVLYS